MKVNIIVVVPHEVDVFIEILNCFSVRSITISKASTWIFLRSTVFELVILVL